MNTILTLLIGAGLISYTNIAVAQHTFSIVAVDSITGEIGSAGATCGDSVIWPGTKGAVAICDIVPGVGAINTQAYYLPENQTNAHNKMIQGMHPEEIIDWIIENDVTNEPKVRQYGVVDYNDGHPRSAAYTGEDCFNYKNHITGPNYSIQGNILLGQQILDQMETEFLNKKGTLADKLMAAMQGANIIGADTRCAQYNVSSLSSYLRVANKDSVFLDIVIAATPDSLDPIDTLQTRYDKWKKNSNASGTGYNEGINKELFEIYPNPNDGILYVSMPSKLSSKSGYITITDLMGQSIIKNAILINQQEQIIPTSSLNSGTYFLSVTQDNFNQTQKFQIIN